MTNTMAMHTRPGTSRTESWMHRRPKSHDVGKPAGPGWLGGRFRHAVCVLDTCLHRTSAHSQPLNQHTWL